MIEALETNLEIHYMIKVGIMQIKTVLIKLIKIKTIIKTTSQNNQQQQQPYQNENLNNRATNANSNKTLKVLEISNKQLDKIKINQ